MRYRTQRLTALLLVFTLVFQLLPIPAFASGSRGLPSRAQRADASAPQSESGFLRTSAASASTVAITAPADMAVVTKPTEVVGTAMAEGLTRYRLACAPG